MTEREERLPGPVLTQPAAGGRPIYLLMALGVAAAAVVVTLLAVRTGHPSLAVGAGLLLLVSVMLLRRRTFPRSIENWFAPADRQPVRQWLARVALGERVDYPPPRIDPYHREAPRPQLSGFPIYDPHSAADVATGIVGRSTNDPAESPAELRERVRFQGLVNELSTLFLNAAGEELDKVIDHALCLVGEFAAADRCFAIVRNVTTLEATETHEWTREPHPPGPPLSLVHEELPDLCEPLRRAETIAIVDVEAATGASPRVARLLRDRRIRALLLVPVVRRGEVVCAVGLAAHNEARNWSPAIAQLAQTLGEVISIAISRRQSESEARGYSEALEALVRARTARIRQLERQRLEEEKLAATARMSARIAHEINNPLAGIKNGFRLLKGAIPADHQHASYVPRIEREIDRIARIVRQMYDIYRPEKEVAREFNLDEAVNDVIALLEPAWQRRGLSIDSQCRPPRVVVVLPEMSLRQVLFNLLANGIEASPAGGTIGVRVAEDDRCVTIEITDCGSGVPDWAAERIFEPFFTTKHTSDGSGLGLGLSISRGLVEAMGGTISFKSVPAHGTLFRVALPACDPRLEATDD